MDQADSLALVLLTLLLAAAGVVVAGVALARSGDVLAARTRMGGLWVGLVFLAFATSLPELITAGTAVRLGAVDLAAGDLFGSNMANMAILALLNLLPGAALFHRAALDQGLVASHAIVLTSVAAASIVLGAPAAVAGLGPGSLLLLVAYLTGSHTLYRHAATVREVVAETETVEVPSA
ncbi:MAG: sodium:calcium antiporter, partial [Gemmatimonadota bacterium]